MNEVSGDCVWANGLTTLVLRFNGQRIADASDDDATDAGFRWMALATATSEPTAEVRFDNAGTVR
jgi:hypothetical protein